jgi:type III secretory pathway component EscU
MMDIFTKKLEKLIQSVKFWKLSLYKTMWNFTSSKFQVFIVLIIFFAFGMVDQTTFLVGCGIYAGARVLEGIKVGKNKNDNNN